MRSVGVAVSVSLLFAAGAAVAAPFEATREHRSARHAHVVLAKRSGVAATMLIEFETGSLDDGDEGPLARLAQLSLLNSEGALRLEEEVYRKGAVLASSLGPRRTTFVLTADDRDFSTMSKKLLSVLFDPRLDPDAYARARRTIERPASRMSRDALPAIIDRAFSPDVLTRRRPTKSSAEGILDERIGQRIRAAFTPANAVVVVTGSFSTPMMRQRLLGLAGGVPRPTRKMRTLPKKELVLPAAREHRLLIYPASFETTEERAAALVARAAVEEMLHTDLRHRGLVYAASVETIETEWWRGFVVSLPLHVDASRTVVHTTHQLIESFVGDLPEDALARNRARQEALFVDIDRDPERLATHLVVDATTDPLYTPALAEAIRSLSPEQTREVARRVFVKHSSSAIHLSEGAAGQ